MLIWGGAPYGGVLCDCVLFFEGNSSDSCGRRHPQLPMHLSFGGTASVAKRPEGSLIGSRPRWGQRGIEESERQELVYSKDELLTAPPPTTKSKHQGKERLLASKHPLGTGHSQTIFCGCVCRAPLGVGKLGEAPLKRQVK